MAEFDINPELQKKKYKHKIVEAMFCRAHPFECATTSFHEFAKHMEKLRRLPDKELRHVISRLFELMDDKMACCACYAKCAAFGELIAGHRLPDDKMKFGKLLDERVAAQELEKPGSTGDRDFREEVLNVIKKYIPDFDAGTEETRRGG